MPEREEDDRFHHEELQHWAVRLQQISCGEVEEKQSVERETDRDVIDDGHV